VIIHPLETKDEEKVREFYRLHAGDKDGSLARSVLEGSAGVAAEDKEQGLLAVGFMRAADIDLYEMVDMRVRPDHREMGLEAQMLLTLELTAEKRRARFFGVWLRSDVCDAYSYADINERMRYLERGYRFRSYRADREGGDHRDRLDKELQGDDLLGMTRKKGRKSGYSQN